MAAACGALWEAKGLYAGLTTQQVGGGVRGAVGVDQLPVEVVLLALAVLTRAGVRVLVKRAACSWRERGQPIRQSHTPLCTRDGAIKATKNTHSHGTYRYSSPKLALCV